jgi:CRP-like cAMP-binding protein
MKNTPRRRRPVPNQLLAALPRRDRERITATCDVVQMEAGESLFEPGEQIRFVYFPTGSVVSLLSTTDSSSQVEVALIGAEGMVGMSSMLDVETAPFRALVQGNGSALRMRTDVFLRHLKHRPALARRVARYLYVRVVELAQMVTCTRFHAVEPRLARWLLMTRDRTRTEHFHVTQELMAHMLGVRRAGITVAAGSLQSRGLISYRRGLIAIRSGKGLERASCSCYARSRESYARCLPNTG